MKRNGETAHLTEQEGPILQSVSTCMNSLRLLGIVPTFYNFSQTEAWWELTKGWTDRQKAKYRAWWTAIQTLQRDAKDIGTVRLILACLVQEKARRNYHKIPKISAAALGVIDERHAEAVREHVRSNYEALDPEKGLGV